MSKFVITQDALNGFMDAFSGRAKQQGQIDGLKIQAAQDLAHGHGAAQNAQARSVHMQDFLCVYRQ